MNQTIFKPCQKQQYNTVSPPYDELRWEGDLQIKMGLHTSLIIITLS